MSNVTGDWFFFNKTWREFTGSDAIEAGPNWRELIHPDDRAGIQELFRKHFEARTPYRIQCRLRRRDGTHRWVISHPAPYYDAQNQFAGFISTCFDFHEQHELEAALAKRAHKQAGLAAFGRFALAPHAFAELTREAAHTMLDILDVDCVMITAVNHATRQLARGALACRLGGGNPPQDLGAVPPAALACSRPVLMDEDPENFPAAACLKANGIATALACPIGSGKQLHGFILASTRERRAFTPDSIEFVQGVAGILVTVNQRDRANKALAESEQRLFDAQKTEAIGLLAGGLAHDFKNLLTVIRGYTELMQKDLAQLARIPAAAPLLGAPAMLNIRARHAGIIDATNRADKLTRQLLAFSRGQTARIERIDLNEIIDGNKELIASFLRGGIHLNLAQSPAPVFARADRNQIEQVILNLAINARDAMPDGGTLTIGTETCEITGKDNHHHNDNNAPAGHAPLKKGAYAKITVTDTGTGIPPEIQPKIFAPFFTIKARANGTGLGLPTSANIVQNARGAISFETTPGKGTTFTVLLPDFEPARAGPAKTSPSSTPFLDAADIPAEPPADAELPAGAETLLLVEDDTAIREVTTAILESLGYAVRAFATGDALLAQPGAADGAQLLITDLNMPGLGGRQLAGRMRAAHPALRVLFISGFIDDDVRQSKVRFLEKPFTRAVLAQKVREALAAD